jgi:hypothetical protein
MAGRPLLSHGVVRWTIAAIVGSTVTAGLFASMTRMIDGSWILDQMLRVFPLEQTGFVDPCEVWEPEQTLVTIEGTVGYLGSAGFVALPEAQMIGEHGNAPPQRVEVSDAGGFRFVTPFEERRPEKCSDLGELPEPPSPRLLIQAPGCATRSVPVTRNWLRHRVLLDCEERSRRVRAG